MNDIATASDRGRRTIYTYFRTKNEIFEAVVADQSNRILADLEASIAAGRSATEKLRALIVFRIGVARENPKNYSVWYRSLFSANVKRSVAVREMVTTRLYELMDEILRAGVGSGEFDPEQARRTPGVLTMLIRGTDWTIMRQAEQEKYSLWEKDSIDFIIHGLVPKQ